MGGTHASKIMQSLGAEESFQSVGSESRISCDPPGQTRETPPEELTEEEQLIDVIEKIGYQQFQTVVLEEIELLEFLGGSENVETIKDAATAKKFVEDLGEEGIAQMYAFYLSYIETEGQNISTCLETAESVCI